MSALMRRYGLDVSHRSVLRHSRHLGRRAEPADRVYRDRSRGRRFRKMRGEFLASLELAQHRLEQMRHWVFAKRLREVPVPEWAERAVEKLELSVAVREDMLETLDRAAEIRAYMQSLGAALGTMEDYFEYALAFPRRRSARR